MALGGSNRGFSTRGAPAGRVTIVSSCRVGMEKNGGRQPAAARMLCGPRAACATANPEVDAAIKWFISLRRVGIGELQQLAQIDWFAQHTVDALRARLSGVG